MVGYLKFGCNCKDMNELLKFEPKQGWVKQFQVREEWNSISIAPM